jgi:hypothetical protein
LLPQHIKTSRMTYNTTSLTYAAICLGQPSSIYDKVIIFWTLFVAFVSVWNYTVETVLLSPFSGKMPTLLGSKNRGTMPDRRQGLAVSIGSKWVNFFFEDKDSIQSLQCNFKQKFKYKTPWPESTNELYRLSNRRLSAKWLPTFGDRGCHVVSVKDHYGLILGFLDRSRYFSIK